MTSALDDVILSVMVCFNDSLNSSEILIWYEERVLGKIKSNYSPYGVASDDIVLTMNLPMVMLLMHVTNMFWMSHISYVISTHVGYFHDQCMKNRLPSQWYDEPRVIASFSEAVIEPVYSGMMFTQAEISS